MASPLARACWSLARSRHDGAKCVIVNRGEVVLVRHTYGDRRSWELPGGFIRRGEEPGAAARRELGEELGLHVAAAQLQPLGQIAHPAGRRRGIVHYFRVDLADRSLAADPVELAVAAWFSPARLPRPLGDQVEATLAWIARPASTGSGTPCVSIGGRQSGESRGAERAQGADPQT